MVSLIQNVSGAVHRPVSHDELLSPAPSVLCQSGFCSRGEEENNGHPRYRRRKISLRQRVAARFSRHQVRYMWGAETECLLVLNSLSLCLCQGWAGWWGRGLSGTFSHFVMNSRPGRLRSSSSTETQTTSPPSSTSTGLGNSTPLSGAVLSSSSRTSR